MLVDWYVVGWLQSKSQLMASYTHTRWFCSSFLQQWNLFSHFLNLYWTCDLFIFYVLYLFLFLFSFFFFFLLAKAMQCMLLKFWALSLRTLETNYAPIPSPTSPSSFLSPFLSLSLLLSNLLEYERQHVRVPHLQAYT